MTDLAQRIETELKDYIDDETVIAIWNDYSSDPVFSFDDDELNMMFPEPAKLARAIYFGNVKSWIDPWFYFNGYGNIVTFTTLDGHDSPIVFKELAEWLAQDERYVKYDIELDDELDDEAETDTE